MTKYFYLLLFLFLVSCSRTVTHVSEISPEYVRLDKKQNERDPAITALINPYKNQLDESMNVVIGVVEKDMEKRKPNSALNNWVADILLETGKKHFEGKIDFAVQNYGGIRVPSISKGDLTIGKVFELMPFDNLVTIITAKGDIVRKLFVRIAEYGGWPLSNGSVLTIKNNKLESVMINGEELADHKEYTFVLPDYIANGGDNCFFLTNQKRKDLRLLIRDAIIQHVKSTEGLIPFNNEKRITIQ